jgi:NADPH-dependent curcumin reductase CurA
MTPVIPGKVREIRLARVPEGLPGRGDFTVAEVPPPVPDAGQVLVRNRHFLVFAALRTLIGGEVEDAPLPPLRPGDPLFGPAVGEVVTAPEGGALRPGDTVLHMAGWREYAVLPPEQCTRLDGALPDPAAHLGQGAVAYGALTRAAEVRAGDTVLVTGAAGAVGSSAGSVARLLGAGRVVGSTGSAWKADRLTAELGYDAVVLRGAGSFAARLAEAAPQGVDVVLDTVGGEQLAAAVQVARHGARFALVGALRGQLSPQGAGGTAPVELDGYRLILKGISLRGYTGADHPGVDAEWSARFGSRLRSGEIPFPSTRIAGLAQAPQAFEDLLAGHHFGTVVVDL